jgi:queuine tRNA-ribosyltransferase
MSSHRVRFELLHVDENCAARASLLHTPHGTVQLPTFMPVGTIGTVKGLTAELVARTGAQIVLGNTYHLTLRPGEDVVAELGGLHRFSGWTHSMLTDSGGFQLFSLAKLTKINENGAVFRSHIDGSKLELTPERSIEIQESLGADIAMVLDHVTPLPCEESQIEEACARTIRWAERCLKHAKKPDQSLFAIVQGGLNPTLRVSCAQELAKYDFPGYAIGGLSVGEKPQEMYDTIAATCPVMPTGKPRYLMGVGRPEDLLEAIERGVDMFDCVMPTRNGRNALAFTDEGPLHLRNLCHARDQRPIQDGFPHPLDQTSRGYIRHLFMAGEMLGPILVSFHNLCYYQKLMRDARIAIQADCFPAFKREKFANWGIQLG